MNDRFNKNCGEIVKFDDCLIQEKLINHPTFILSSNDIKSLKPEYSKRIIVDYIEGNLPKIKATTNHKKMSELRKTITTSFFSEYLARMFPAVMNLISEMENFEMNPENESWIPDIYTVSSNIIIDIFNDCNIAIPQYIRTLTYDDYFGRNAVGSRIFNKIRNEWIHNRKAFTIQQNVNRLEYQPGENSYEATWVCNELPAELCAERFGLKVVMKLDKAKEFFGIEFKKKFWER